MKKLFCVILSLVLILQLLSGCRGPEPGVTENTVSLDIDRLSAALDTTVPFAEDYGIRAAVVYSQGDTWQDTLYYLEQSPMLGLEVEGIQAHELYDPDQFDILYLDESLLLSAPDGFVAAMEAYTQRGGSVFLPNGFCNVFSEAYLGISETLKFEGFPEDLTFPTCKDDEGTLQQIIRDYRDLYVQFSDFDVTRTWDYGYGFRSDSALPLVLHGDIALYTLNAYGNGYVFLTNPILPNAYSTGSLTMEIEEGNSTFASTTASFNQLILSGFAEYIAKQRYGYALERAYGYYGTPSMAWELHYEEITGIENNSMEIFSELCQEYGQIPSFTLIRNSYTWFLRAESVTYLLSESADHHSYSMDLYENAYSSGTHIDADGSWLMMNTIEDAGSYFADYPQYTIRAYPQVTDLDGDGNLDILSGSSDGKIYFFRGKGFYNNRLHAEAATILTQEDGTEITCGSYSAVRAVDLNGDSIQDLICGGPDGTLYGYTGQRGDLSFAPRGILMKTDIRGQILPAVGDLNGDGITDLAVGSDQGILILYYGTRDTDGGLSFRHTNSTNLSKLCVNANLGKWLAPSVTDWNHDGNADLAVGVFDGYIALLLSRDDGTYSFSDYMTNDEMNYKGNHNLKFGNWAAPCFADLNGDGNEDLICGSQEYGMAYPIDSEYFPYREHLQEQIDFAAEEDYYVGVHFYTNAYASAERENYELLAHRKALEAYGMDTSKMGANQHTWYTSTLSGSQSMSSIYRAGLFWQSGFAAPGSRATTPQSVPENVVALPFYLRENGSKTTLVQNNSTLMYGNKDWNSISAQYGMPVCIYYHCDFAYESEDASRNALQAVQEFRETYGYNLNREDQLMFASAAALHQRVESAGSIEGPRGISIRTIAPTEEYDLYDNDVYESLGAKLIFSDRLDPNSFAVDADIWYNEGNALIIGLNRPVRIYKGTETGSAHIRRINMASRISPCEGSVEIQFLSGGMMELAVEGYATTDSPGWTVIHKDNETIFRKYGSNESLHVIY